MNEIFMKRIRIMTVIALALIAMAINAAQAANPVQWTAKVEMTGADQGVVVLSASIEDGWHMYGLQMPADGPSATKIYYAPTGVEFTGNAKVSPAPKKEKDDMFGVELTYWEGKVTFRRPFKVTNASKAAVHVKVSFMACNDSNCQPPSTKEFDLKIGR